jgi:HSP20 family protein
MLWPDFERLGRFWDPWQDFERMRRSLFGNGRTSAIVEFPAVNIWVDGDDALVTAEIPGVDPDTIELSVVGKSLILRGIRQPEEIKDGETYHRQERWQGRFSKTVELPFAVESDKVNARFTKGILSVELPRAEAEKPKKIAVKSA